MKYFEKNKRKWFPEIKDWTDPQNHYRFEKDVLNMPYKYFFFFSPDNFKLITYGLPIMSIIVFGSVTYLSLINKQYIILALSSIIVIHQLMKLIEKIKYRKITKEMNLYDLWFREVE